MKIEAFNAEEYISKLPEDRREPMRKLRSTILNNFPAGFSENMQYNMISFVVPYSLYPAGYHCDPKLPLPFLSIASQKNFVALYHMGIYADKNLLDWFTAEYPKYCKTKLDMGKSCIRFKKPDEIPFELMGELAKKISPEMWIESYERNFKNKSK